MFIGADAGSRQYNYTEFVGGDATGWAVRDARYKLIHFEDGSEELYDLSVDLGERDDLIADTSLRDTVDRLGAYGASQRE